MIVQLKYKLIADLALTAIKSSHLTDIYLTNICHTKSICSSMIRSYPYIPHFCHPYLSSSTIYLIFPLRVLYHNLHFLFIYFFLIQFIYLLSKEEKLIASQQTINQSEVAYKKNENMLKNDYKKKQFCSLLRTEIRLRLIY